METSLLIAKLLGVYFMVSGVFLVTRKKTFGLVIKDLFENKALVYFIGALLAVGGAGIIMRDNITSGGLELFVTIIGWAILAKGVLYIFAPESLRSMARSVTASVGYQILGGIIAVIGVYLVFFLG